MLKGLVEDNMLKCPFCDRTIEEPQEIRTRFGNTFSGGKCECGAVYVYDRSGHSLGDAYVDALAYACDNDWDLAWSLTPGEDYEVRELSYDSRRNKFLRDPGRRGRSSAIYLFLLVKRAIA